MQPGNGKGSQFSLETLGGACEQRRELGYAAWSIAAPGWKKQGDCQASLKFPGFRVEPSESFPPFHHSEICPEAPLLLCCRWIQLELPET